MTLTRVVVTGSESVGKTTLATQLASHHHALCVPEFVRGYAERKQGPIDVPDHWPIARGQVEQEAIYLSKAAELGHSLLVQDTDLLSTVAYCYHYTSGCDAGIERLAAERCADHYLLLDIDVPWVFDGIRDRGDRRAEVQALFVETLERFGAPFTLITGTWGERMALAERVVAELRGRTVVERSEWSGS